MDDVRISEKNQEIDVLYFRFSVVDYKFHPVENAEAQKIIGNMKSN